MQQFVRILLLLLSIIRFVHGQDQDPDMIFEGYDCFRPYEITPVSRLRDPVDCNRYRTERSQQNITFTVLQKEVNQHAKGFRCRKILSKHVTYCGTYDHSTELYDAQIDNVPQHVSAPECKRMVYKHEFEDDVKVVHTVLPQKTNHISFHEKGTTQVDGGEVTCTGETYKYNGKIIYRAIVHTTYKIVIERVDIKSRSGSLFDMTNRISLEGTYQQADSDAGANGRYIWKPKTEVCPMAIVRDRVIGIISEDNDGHRVLMSTGGDLMRFILKRPTITCDADLYNTNYEDFYIFYDTENPTKRPPFIKKLNPSNTQLFTYAEATR